MLAALAGGAALMGRGKKKFGTDAGFLKSGAAGGASLSSPPIGGTDHIPPKTDWITKKVAAPVKKVTSAYPRSSRGIGDYGVVTAPTRVNGVQIKGRQNAQPITPFHPSQGNVRKAFTMQGDTRGWKKGGRVTGIAKRGFGRALMKGKK